MTGEGRADDADRHIDPHPYGYYNEEGQLSGIESFDLLDRVHVDDFDLTWEIQVPGMSRKASWAQPWNPAIALQEALDRILPDYEQFGLDEENALKLLFRLKILRGTGMEVEDLPPPKREHAQQRLTKFMEDRGLI